jgi:pectinesterase
MARADGASDGRISFSYPISQKNHPIYSFTLVRRRGGQRVLSPLAIDRYDGGGLMGVPRWSVAAVFIIAASIVPYAVWADDAKPIVVAQDGSGQFSTVQAAIDSIPTGGTSLVLVHIKPGKYKEQITLSEDKPPIRMYGDDAETTILTFDRQARMKGENGKPIGTFKTASTYAYASDFEADDLTFENSTPRDISQALALSALGDRQIYRRCRLLGWQDTLYANGGNHGPTLPTSEPSTRAVEAGSVPPTARQYFEDCYIEGGVDFIFGNSTAVFNRCLIFSKRKGHLTAADTPQGVAYGYVFMNCTLLAAKDVAEKSVDLGRPWRDYANVVYLNCDMGPQITAAGWGEWKGFPERDQTVRYAEFGSTGPGGDMSGRVAYEQKLSADQANAITIQSVLGGPDNWDPHPVPPPGNPPTTRAEDVLTAIPATVPTSVPTTQP